MLFTSFEFWVFFLTIYVLYLLLSFKWQNGLLLMASYVFYGMWDWRFLSLISATTLLDYFCALRIHSSTDPRNRKLFLLISVCGNLSILGFVKYFQFFSASFQSLMNYLGIPVQPHLLQIILPVGISFYTFRSMSYTIDVYRREMKATTKLVDYALFVAFFPELLAGPIERAKSFLPQIASARRVALGKFLEGCHLIFWGLFQKIFVADNLAKIVNQLFRTSPPYNGVEVLIGLYAFAFQIYCDFAGYSHMARGLGRCMGFEIINNFNLPYFATNPREFWRRWHISLSSWFHDYVYVPLGGNKRGRWKTYKNLLVTMLACGLWHGASWTFVMWGAYHGVLLAIHRISTAIVPIKLPSSWKFCGDRLWFLVKLGFSFHLLCLGWLVFRGDSMNQVLSMFEGIFLNFKFLRGIGLKYNVMQLGFLLAPLMAIQIIQYWKKDLMIIYRFPIVLNASIHAGLFYLMVLYSSPGYQFIYFQF